jgi:predicted nicotinamide N-methyase
LTVGSSPYWSSPTAAAAIAARIAAVGRVTVSERRSIAVAAAAGSVTVIAAAAVGLR